MNVIKAYVDKAKTGTNDNRPDFQRMMKDAASGAFQYVIVYMLDRFARNRMDSMMNKARLHDNGVKVLSAIENISDTEEGEFFEMFLEWNAEKYSKRLSKRVRDGIDTSVANGTFTGGYVLYGYRVDKTEIAGKKGKYIQRVVIDEEQAEVIRYIFIEYARGVSKDDIANALNAQGKRYNGKPFKGRTFDNWLLNEKYTGEFTFGGRTCNNMYPPLIDRRTFEKAQDLLIKNKYFAKSNTPRIPFYLTSKLYCGHSGTAMVADGGVGRLGTTYQYYVCKAARKKACDKKREEKDELEKTVTEQTVGFLRDPVMVNRVADDVIAYYKRKSDESELKSVETRIVIVKREMDDTTAAYVQAVAAQNTLLQTGCQTRINELGALLDDLQMQYSQLELERGMAVTKQDIIAFVAEFTDGDCSSKAFQKRVIDNLVSTAYAYDGRVVVYFSIKGGGKGVPFISKAERDGAIKKESEPAVGSDSNVTENGELKVP